MSLIRRMQRITRNRVEQYLADHPGEAGSVALSLADAEQELGRAEGKARSAYRKAQERVDATQGRIARLDRGAELAVRQEQHELAREALGAQIAAEEELKRQRESLDRSRTALADARAARAHIRHLRTLFGSASAPPSSPDPTLLTRIAALPDDAPGPGTPPPPRTLDERLAKLERDSVVEQRLQHMKLTRDRSRLSRTCPSQNQTP